MRRTFLPQERPRPITPPAIILARGSSARKGDSIMLYWAVVFFIIALAAALFGFTGVEVAAAGVARILFLVFLVLFVVSLIGGIARRV